MSTQPYRKDTPAGPFKYSATPGLDEIHIDAPFIFVVEGSIPTEKINGDGYWTSFGNDPQSGEPLTLSWWIDRLAPRAWAVVAAGTCATYGGIHAMAGNPTGCMGPPTTSAGTSARRAGCRSSTRRGAPCSPTSSRPCCGRCSRRPATRR